MTTIVYRDKVLAGDRRAYAGDSKPVGNKTKVHRLSDGTLFGCSSACVGADAILRRWVEGGCIPPATSDLKPDAFELLLIRGDGRVFYAKDNLDLTGPLDCEFIAIGSGDRYAMGALAMGANARRAVEVATELDAWTGNGVDVIRL